MTDLALRWDNDARRFDLVLSAADAEPACGPDLETEVTARLWTWRRAEPSDALPDGAGGERQGWWGDATLDGAEARTGCRWWLLARRVITDAVLAEARGYVREALRGLVDDGIAARVDVEVFRAALNTVGCIVTIHRADGSRWTRRYDDLWNAIGSPA